MRVEACGVRAGRTVVAASVLLGMMAPAPTWAGSCDDKLGGTTQMTGTYVAAGQDYARAFVFAMRADCRGRPELITVQRSTGHLPVCSADQPVEVVGKLVWNRALVDGHYEINNPSKVACVPVARTDTRTAQAPDVPGPAPLPAPTRPPEPRGVAPSVWVGRYEDSRGTGGVTVTLVRGTSTVSGTWRLRTGGGGPLAGSLQGDGGLEFRMENLALECPGTFQGRAELGDVTLAGTYSGRDCEGSVTDGRLELRLR